MQAISAPSRLGAALALALLLAACGGGGGGELARTPSGPTALASATPEVSGDCTGGAMRVRIGFDTDGDGSLEASEVSYTELVCTASATATTLTSVVTEPAGGQCAAGGQRVMVGQDANGDGALQAVEVVSSAYLCHGAAGATGPQGAPGPEGPQGPQGPAGNNGSDGSDGSNGADGASGSDGINSLLSLSVEPAGARCAAGGTRVESGRDADRDGTLDAAEVTHTAYVCAGADGGTGPAGPAGPAGPTGPSGPTGSSSLLLLLPEPAGSNCAAGGTRVQTGVDANGNAVLDAAEVSGTAFVCSGLDASVHAEWQPAQVAATNPVNGTVKIAAAGDGSVFAAWAESLPDDTYVLKARRHLPSGGWTAPVTLGTAPNGGFLSQLSLSAAGNGHAVIFWRRYTGTASEYHVAVHTTAAGWGTPVQVEDTGDLAMYPSQRTSMNAAGEAVVVLYRDGSSPSAAGVWAMRYRPATGWGAAVRLGPTIGLAGQPCMDAGGRVQLAWLAADGANGADTWVAQGESDGSWGAPQRLDSLANTEPRSPMMGCSAGGHAVFAWQPPGQPLRAMRYLAGSGWQAPANLDTDPGLNAVFLHPAVAVDAAGNALVVWTPNYLVTGPLYARFAPAAGGWQARTVVQGAEAYSHTRGEFNAAFDAQGRAHVTWSKGGARFARFDPLLGWSGAAVLDDQASTFVPVLAFDGLGRGMAAWTAPTGPSQTGVRYARYR